MNIGSSTEKDTYEINKTNWEKYSDILKGIPVPKILNESEINVKTLNLQQNILNAYREATKTTIKDRNQIDTLPFHIKDLIKEKNRARRKHHRTLDLQDKTHLNYLTTQDKIELDEYRNKKWNDKVELLSVKDNSVWKIAKALKNRQPTRNIALKVNNTLAVNDTEKADLLAQTMCNQFKPHNLDQELDKKISKN